MADAIPVHSEPKRKVAVKPAEMPVDKNGVPVPGDYVSQVRDGLGDPEDYGTPTSARTMESNMDTIQLVDGKSAVVPHTHHYTREDF